MLRAAVVACILPAAAASARSAPDPGISQLGLVRWTTDSGLAGNWVRAIAETPDGMLWVATVGGLSRFDGQRFVNFTAANETALPGNGIAALAPRARGGLWVGLDIGGVRVAEQREVWALPELAPLEALQPTALLEEPAGTLWIGTASGLSRWRDGGLEAVAPAGLEANAEIRALVGDPAGGLWVRTRDHGIWRIEQDRPRSVPDVPGCAGLDLAVGGDGRLFTACVAGTWERGPAGEWRELESGNVNRIHLDRRGRLWTAGIGGLRRRASSGRSEGLPPERLGDHRVRTFFEDQRGGLWIGSYAGGLAWLRTGAVTAVGAPEGLAIDGPTGVVGTPDGGVWIGTAAMGALRWHPDRGIMERWGVAQGLPSDAVWSIDLDPKRPQRIWLGTAAGLVELDGGRARRIERPEGRTADGVRLLYADPVGPERIWAGGVTGGLDELRDGEVIRHDARNGLGLARVSGLGRLRSGELLAVGAEGLYVYDGERWRERVPPGPPMRGVKSFAESADGTLWLISANRGLVRWRGELAVSYGEREGLSTNNLYSLHLDAEGGLWLSSDDGVAHLRSAEFERRLRGESDIAPLEWVTERDGLRERECNGWGRPASSQLADGRLVYPTAHGIALVDPARLSRAELATAKIYIGRAWSGERFLGWHPPWRLAKNERHLRVRFGAVEFLLADAVQFRYRLLGLGRDWQLVGATREANYSYLPPGRYEFEVQARLPGQEWVAASQTAAVWVEARFWESQELRLAVAALALLAALALFRWRTRVERLHNAAIARERTLLREVIDTCPDPISAKGRDFVYTLANRAAASVYGVEPRELVGRRGSDLAPRIPGMDSILALDHEVLASGEERVLSETKVVDAKGATRWFRVVKRPLRGAAGEVEQVLGTAVDVTDFKDAEERLRAQEVRLRASREELRHLARQLIRAQEDERSRLAREIHDDLTQRLAGLAMLTGSVAKSVEKGLEAPVAATLDEIGHELERLASDTQALARDLHPALLENLGLVEALRSECATFGQRTGLQIRFESHRVPAPLPEEVSLTLYRITQEALRNVLSHAGAANVSVRLERKGQNLALSIADSGAGFSPVESTGAAGIGLTSMTERARLIGADFQIESAPGRGTRLCVTVPDVVGSGERPTG